MPAGIGSHTSPVRGETDEWITPPKIIESLGPFDLDPCCPALMPWSTAAVMYSRENVGCGLSHEWFGRVWLNPPYGKQTGQWLHRLANHGEGTALVFARTETSMFFAEVWNRATALLFIEGRLHFHYRDGTRAKGNAGGPSVLVAYGERDAEQLKESGIRGHFVRV